MCTLLDSFAGSIFNQLYCPLTAMLDKVVWAMPAHSWGEGGEYKTKLLSYILTKVIYLQLATIKGVTMTIVHRGLKWAMSRIEAFDC